jgi:hypothetical protein
MGCAVLKSQVSKGSCGAIRQAAVYAGYVSRDTAGRHGMCHSGCIQQQLQQLQPGHINQAVLTAVSQLLCTAKSSPSCASPTETYQKGKSGMGML